MNPLEPLWPIPAPYARRQNRTNHGRRYINQATGYGSSTLPIAYARGFTGPGAQAPMQPLLHRDAEPGLGPVSVRTRIRHGRDGAPEDAVLKGGQRTQ
jgi:hypothetical protein